MFFYVVFILPRCNYIYIDQLFFLVYRILNVAIANNTHNTVTIQKRTAILLS